MILCAWIAAALAAACQRTARPAADTLFVGDFLTLDSDRPRAQAVAVAGGRIVAVGGEEEVAAHVGPATRRVMLPGTAVAGLADAHVHTLGLGEQLERLNLRGLQKEAIAAAVADQARVAPPGEWILGGGWDQGFWPSAAFPTAADLDPVSNGHPVMLYRIDLHSAWLNSAALQAAGITAATRDPAGGRIVRDAGGRPTGMLIDGAVTLAERAMPSPTRDQIERRMRAALAQYAAWGLTSIHDAGAGLDEIAVYKDLLTKGELPVRAYVMVQGAGEAAHHYLERGPEIGLGDGRLTIRSFKVMLDGALGSRGAQLLAPYTDAPAEDGLDLIQDGDLEALIRPAAERGFQVNAHAIGDRAVRRALDAFERAAGPVEALRPRRFRIEHVSMLSDADLPRFARLGVIASMQPNFVGEYSRWAIERVGTGRIETVYRTGDLLRSGAVVAAGSDYPAADAGDPVTTLACMVTREGARGGPAGGWHPDQRATVDETLKAMTWAPAFAAFQEGELGRIAPGMRADFTVLSASPHDVPPGRLRELEVLMTVVGGATTFVRDGPS